MITIERFCDLVARLRDSQHGCPWDLKQNFQTMIPNLLEETYEVAEALHTHDKSALREELGDLLLQVVFLSRLAEEEGSFNFNDVLNDIHEKLIFRHPHVFGDASAANSEEALKNWEAMKNVEQKRQAHTSILDDIPYALPALSRAHKLQKRCAKVGFDWDNPQQVFDKVQEELREVREEMEKSPLVEEKLAEELGDLLFASVNLCRHYQQDAESCLRNANVKFEHRFKKLEQAVISDGKNIRDCSLNELDQYWEKIKLME